MKVIVVLPALNAERTLAATFESIPEALRADAVLVDDGSTDGTLALAARLGIAHVIAHPGNEGYGANQKTCYRKALSLGADVVVMLHPDNQYDARLIPAFVDFIVCGTCDVVLGNRVRSRGDALAGGMPLYKYVANRALTLLANLCLGTNVGDFHSGLRVYSRQLLETLPWARNADDFAFDPQMLAQAVAWGFRIGDAPVPCSYPADASSIRAAASIRYGFQVLGVLGSYALGRYTPTGGPAAEQGR